MHCRMFGVKTLGEPILTFTLRNKIQRQSNQETKTFIDQITFEKVICIMSIIFKQNILKRHTLAIFEPMIFARIMFNEMHTVLCSFDFLWFCLDLKAKCDADLYMRTISCMSKGFRGMLSHTNPIYSFCPKKQHVISQTIIVTTNEYINQWKKSPKIEILIEFVCQSCPKISLDEAALNNCGAVGRAHRLDLVLSAPY